VDRSGRQRDAWRAASEALGVGAIREVERELARFGDDATRPKKSNTSPGHVLI
jgi:hypothetical protein